ncbi:MAG: DUF3024 domain-containing protein [Candidatus Eisenbacteria bacterium]|nr:DUF3024 domain-containing protein [Candidatus Eisenbacteria bacterium]
MKLGFSEKLLWAEKAARLDVETEKGYREFYAIAKRSGLGEMWLSYYANAYEAAGASGLRALSYRRKIAPEIRKHAIDKISKYLVRRVPVHLRSEVGFLVKAQDNRITVSEERPLLADPTETSCSDVFQVRYTDFDNRWHLYWMRKSGTWWPYIPDRPIHTIQDCIREVKADSWGCFWV